MHWSHIARAASGSRRVILQRRSIAPAPLLDPLEPRQLLANIAWDGGPTGNGTSWDLAANWAGDVLPGKFDNVTIGATGISPTITSKGDVAVNGLTLSRSASIGGALGVGAGSTVNAGVVLSVKGLTGGGNLQVNGQLAWVDGVFDGPGAVNIGSSGTLVVQTHSAQSLRRVINNSGKITTGVSSLAFVGGTINNLGGGVIEIGSDSTFTLGAGTSTLNNSGAVNAGANTTLPIVVNNQSGGVIAAQAGTLTLTGATSNQAGATLRTDGGTISTSGSFSNAGTLLVNAGSVNLLGANTNISGGTLTGGTWQILGGSLSSNGGNITNNNASIELSVGGSWFQLGALITNTGSLTLSAGKDFSTDAANNFTNNGVLKLSIGSDFTVPGGGKSFTNSSGGTLMTAIAGIAPGTLGRVVVGSGSAFLSGAVNVTKDPVYTPTPGDLAPIVTATAVSGTFSSAILPGGPGQANSMSYAPAAARVLFDVLLGYFDGGGDGVSWLDPLNWTKDTLPTSSTDVRVPAGGVSGTQTGPGAWFVRSVTSDEPLTVQGVLTTSATSTMSGGNAITLAGGSLLGAPWSLATGTLNATALGGTLAASIAGAVVVGAAGNDETITLASGASFSKLSLIRNNAMVRMRAGYTLTSEIVAEGAASGTRYVMIGEGGAGTVTIAPAGLVRIASGCAGGLVIQDATSPSALVNQGTIRDEAAQSLFVTTGVWSNAGGATIAATAAGGQLSLAAGSWTNAGTIAGAAGTIVNIGGVFEVSTGAGLFSTGAATVIVTGTIFGPGTLTLDASTGTTWYLSGASILGDHNALYSFGVETLQFAGAGIHLSVIGAGATLKNVHVDGDVAVDGAGAVLRCAFDVRFASARLRSDGAKFTFLGGGVQTNFQVYHLNDPIIAEGSGGSRYVEIEPNGSFMFQPVIQSIAPTGSIRLAAGAQCDLVVIVAAVKTYMDGAISAEAVGQTLIVLGDGKVARMFGTVQALAGTLNYSVADVNLAAGIVSGTWKAIGGTITTPAAAPLVSNTGTIEFGPFGFWQQLSHLRDNPGVVRLRSGYTLALTPTGGSLSNSGTIELLPGSTLNIAGGYAQAGTGTLIVHAASRTSFGRILTNGATSLGGTLTITGDSGYVPQRFDDMQIIGSPSGVVTGTFATTTVPSPTNPNWKSVVVYDAHGVRFLTTTRADINNDGELDLNDFFDFFNAWDVTGTKADLDGDGEVTLLDFFLFFNLFDAG